MPQSISRNITLDLMKAIGIIAIILGHYGIGRQFFYSFHVPLFFIVGGYLFRTKDIRVSLLADSKRLLIPYILTSFVVLLWDVVMSVSHGDDLAILHRTQSIALGGGLPMDYFIFGYQEEFIGAIWFLLALFVCKNTYNILANHLSANWISVSCIALSITSTLCCNYLKFLPLDILQGLSALVFFDAGHRIKEIGGFSKVPKITGFIGIGMWILAIIFSRCLMVTGQYGCYPIDVIGALGASWGIWSICSFAAKMPTSSIRFTAWIGQNSLALLCLHLIDLDTGVLHKLQHWTVDWHYHNNYIHAFIIILASLGLIYCWDKVLNTLKKSKYER